MQRRCHSALIGQQQQKGRVPRSTQQPQEQVPNQPDTWTQLLQFFTGASNDTKLDVGQPGANVASTSEKNTAVVQPRLTASASAYDSSAIEMLFMQHFGPAFWRWTGESIPFIKAMDGMFMAAAGAQPRPDTNQAVTMTPLPNPARETKATYIETAQLYLASLRESDKNHYLNQLAIHWVTRCIDADGAAPAGPAAAILVDMRLRLTYRADYLVSVLGLIRPQGRTCHQFDSRNWHKMHVTRRRKVSLLRDFDWHTAVRKISRPTIWPQYTIKMTTNTKRDSCILATDPIAYVAAAMVESLVTPVLMDELAKKMELAIAKLAEPSQDEIVQHVRMMLLLQGRKGLI
jgi:hypothetical protein